MKQEEMMVLRETGAAGERADYPGYCCPTKRLAWGGTDGSVRTPQPVTREYHVIGGFQAAGKYYLSLKQLTVEVDECERWCRDCYGREVFAVRQKFPCFDSYDYLHEHRYYRWWFIRQGNVLTRIYHTDETGQISVTEDVQDLEDFCWRQMQFDGYCCAK